MHELSPDFPALPRVTETFFVDNSFQKIGNRAMLAHLRLAMPLSVATGPAKALESADAPARRDFMEFDDENDVVCPAKRSIRRKNGIDLRPIELKSLHRAART